METKKTSMWKTLIISIEGEYSPRYVTGAAVIVYRRAKKYLRYGKILSIVSEFHEDTFATYK